MASLDFIYYISSLVLSTVGIYINLAYQRATHRSTVYAKFSGRNLRFLSLAQIALACSNIVATAAMWGSKVNRTRKSEAFFSTVLSMSRALPAATILWTTIERIMFNRSATVRETTKFRYIAAFRVLEMVVSVLMELALRSMFLNNSEQLKEAQEVDRSESAGEDIVIKNSLVANVYFDYYHGFIFVPSIIIMVIMFNSAKGSHVRAGLLGGMRNDQKMQNLGGQISFFKRSYVPLYLACFSDFIMQLIIKRFLDLDETLVNLLYLNARCYLPIVYPLALIALNTHLRADYFANFILCRKARNLHKESKVKVIATRESQESIIANLKMIGILSDVDTSQPGAANLAMMGMMGGATGGPRPASSVGRNSIAKDPTSSTSIGSLPKNSMSGSTPMMMFHTRPKSSLPSVGSVG